MQALWAFLLFCFQMMRALPGNQPPWSSLSPQLSVWPCAGCPYTLGFVLSWQGAFFSCEKWGGEIVSSQLGKWHAIKIEPAWVYSCTLKSLAKSWAEGQSGCLECWISFLKLDFPCIPFWVSNVNSLPKSVIVIIRWEGLGQFRKMMGAWPLPAFEIHKGERMGKMMNNWSKNGECPS